MSVDNGPVQGPAASTYASALRRSSPAVMWVIRSRSIRTPASGAFSTIRTPSLTSRRCSPRISATGSMCFSCGKKMPP